MSSPDRWSDGSMVSDDTTSRPGREVERWLEERRFQPRPASESPAPASRYKLCSCQHLRPRSCKRCGWQVVQRNAKFESSVDTLATPSCPVKSSSHFYWIELAADEKTLFALEP